MFNKFSAKYIVLSSILFSLTSNASLAKNDQLSDKKINIQSISCDVKDSDCAKQFVINIGDATLDTLSKIDSEQERKDRLIQIFDKSVDTDWMAKFVSGSNWRDISDEKREIFKNLYHKYLMEIYIPELNSYSGQSIRYKGVTEEYEGEYLVETEITSQESPSYNVSYKVRKFDNGSYKIFDIVAEGISLISAQRSEFSSILSRKGVDHLIKILKKKTR